MLKTKILNNLSDELRLPKYKGHENQLRGHCYVASEAAWHMWGKENGYRPKYLKVDGETHWYLQHHETGAILDITAEQFDFELDYSAGKGCGFLTKEPCKRTKQLIRHFIGWWSIAPKSHKQLIG